MNKKTNKKVNGLIESLYLFSSFFMIGLLLYVLYFSLSYWTSSFNPNAPIENQAFYLGMMIAIVTSISQWIEGRIKAIIKSIDVLKGGKKK